MSLLDPKELKLVVTMLQRQKAVLTNTLEASQDEKQRIDLAATLKLLESTMGKLITSAKTYTPPTPQHSVPARKIIKRKEPILFADATVLVADDSIDSLMMLRGVLADLGIKKIDSVKDGREALNALQTKSPAYDLVLCDWDMPELSGLEVRKQIKQLAKFQDTHFMMVTSVTEAAKIREAIGQGITDYIIKPIDAGLLERKIKQALGWELDEADKSAPLT